MQRGSAALMERDYETAYVEYKAAVDALPDAPNIRQLRSVAMDGFSKAVMGLAEQRIAEGRWADAQETVESCSSRNTTRTTSPPNGCSPGLRRRTTSTRPSPRASSAKLRKSKSCSLTGRGSMTAGASRNPSKNTKRFCGLTATTSRPAGASNRSTSPACAWRMPLPTRPGPA